MSTAAAAGSRRERKKRETRRRLYEAAVHLFRERGFDGTRVEDITQRADVAVGTFFNYFPAKEAVLTDYHREMIERTVAHARGIREATAEARFTRQMVWCARDATEKHDLLVRILAAQLLYKPTLVRANRPTMARLFDVYDGWIEAGKGAGELRTSIETRTASLTLQELWWHNLVRWAGEPEEIDLVQRMRDRVALVFRGLARSRAAAHDAPP